MDIITFVFSLFGLIRINLLKLLKQKDSIIDTKVTYVFKSNNFKLNKDEYIDYNTLKKVIETDNSYYLYINNSRALIVDKNSFDKDDVNNLTIYLKKMYPLIFINNYV